MATLLAVAPNGARKTKADHPALPLSAQELAETARAAQAAGVAMIHLHVRDEAGKHSLEVARYREAIAAIRAVVEPGFIIQVTSEAVGIYSPSEQIAMVRALEPEAVSLAIRELLPDETPDKEAREFFHWLSVRPILPQYVLYDADDVKRFQSLIARGIISSKRASLLFVLGRYAKDQVSSPKDLDPFLAVHGGAMPWFVCAFGPREAEIAATAARQGGHARIGFENNLLLPDGKVAKDNAQLVVATRALIEKQGGDLVSPQAARALFTAR